MNKHKPITKNLRLTKPEDVVDKLTLSDESVVADFGCGTGAFFSFAIADKLGLKGRIIAIDVQPEIIGAVNSKINMYGKRNVEIKRADLEKIEGSGLEKESVDLVLLVNILHQVKKPEKVITEAKRIVKHDGEVLVYDWEVDRLTMGPKNENRLAKDEAKKLMERNDFEMIRDLDIDEFHYGMIFRRKK